MLVIDPEECIDCGACEPECPVEAIFPEDACRRNGSRSSGSTPRFSSRWMSSNSLAEAYATEHDVHNEPIA